MTGVCLVQNKQSKQKQKHHNTQNLVFLQTNKTVRALAQAVYPPYSNLGAELAAERAVGQRRVAGGPLSRAAPQRGQRLLRGLGAVALADRRRDDRPANR